MYLGQRDSLLAPTGSTDITRVGLSARITSWREDNLDFPWHKFVDWFQQKYASGVRTPVPQPELFYKTMDSFLSDVAQFEKELYGAVISDVPETIFREEEDEFEWEDLEQPPQLPPDYYIPPSATEEGFPWTYVAMGAGALVVVMLALKKKK